MSDYISNLISDPAFNLVVVWSLALGLISFGFGYFIRLVLAILYKITQRA